MPIKEISIEGVVMKNEIKRLTHENKFDLYYWVDNKAKQNWIRFMKRRNNKRYRRYVKNSIKEDYNE